MAVCSTCGTSVPDDARFCSSCGQLIVVVEDQAVQAEPQQIVYQEEAQPQAQEEPQNTFPQQGSYDAPQSNAAPQQSPAPQQSYFVQPQQTSAPQQSYFVQPQQTSAPQQSYYAQPQQTPAPQQSYYAQPQQTPAPQQSYYAQQQQAPAPQQSYYAQPQQTSAPQQSYYAQQGSVPQQQNPNPQQNYYAQQPQQPNNYGYQQNYQQQAQNYQTGPADIEENKGICVLSYLGLLMLIPLLSKPNSAYVRYHSNQGLVLLIMSILIGILTMIPYLGWFIIGPVGYIFTLVCIIMGIVNTVNGQMKPLPLIGQISLIK